MPIQIHKEFTLNGKSFSDSLTLLAFVKNTLPKHLSFLQELFDVADFITVFTSGSTGAPKSINIAKKRMLHSAKATALFFDLPAKTTALHCLSSHFIAGKMMWVRALSLGWCIDVVPVDAKPLTHTKSNYDFGAMVPLQVQNSLEALPRISKLIIGGAPISYDLAQKLKKIHANIYQTYGMTETITHIAVRQLVSKDKKNIFSNLYKTLPGVSLAIDNRNCLLIDAPKISDNQVITNDVVRLEDGNEFEWMGRFDNVINSGGVKLFPEKIEQKLMPFITNEFVITSIPDQNLGEKLVLVIASATPIEAIEDYFLKASLFKFEIPKKVFYLQEFKKTSNGKIKRNDVLIELKKLFL